MQELSFLFGLNVYLNGCIVEQFQRARVPVLKLLSTNFPGRFGISLFLSSSDLFLTSMFRNMNEVCLNSVVILFWILIK